MLVDIVMARPGALASRFCAGRPESFNDCLAIHELTGMSTTALVQHLNLVESA
jgi:hypothetical protein